MAQPHHDNTVAQASTAAASDAIHTIRALIDASDMRAAKQQLRRTRTDLDEHTWAMIGEIANTLRYKTHDVALTKLRKLWRDNEQHRALIEACAPKTDEHQYIPDIEPAATRPTEPRRPTEPLTRRVDPAKRSDPRHRTGNAGATAVEAYENQLDSEERREQGTPRPELIVDRRDYDRDAASKVTEPLCVSCRLERACIDRWTGQITTGHGDDGLCGTCREEGRPGIPELPLGHSRDQAIRARLDAIATNFNSYSPALFRHEWRYGDLHTKDVTQAWVEQDNFPTVVKQSTTTQSAGLNGECAECGDWRQLRDELCVDCHQGLTGDVVLAGSLDPVTIKSSPRERIINDDAVVEDQARTPEGTVNNARYRRGFMRRLSAGQDNSNAANSETDHRKTAASSEAQRQIATTPGSKGIDQTEEKSAAALSPTQRIERVSAATSTAANRPKPESSQDAARRRRQQLRNRAAAAAGRSRRI
ncbi:hypothetical protein NONI108955_21895 [Nocardia ninae]|uniref:Uncharacterized protein n=1 Tax=Nocardia ninae NBRC 108245 TaxID=1210091 RepID=A0A511MTD7_9NOCA|nr:hypothetical protein [Nocardia ninae]GEM43447.1 hypothetical protein NN4_79660 [Nocardia ninae NBRC 108245]